MMISDFRRAGIAKNLTLGLSIAVSLGFCGASIMAAEPDSPTATPDAAAPSAPGGASKSSKKSADHDRRVRLDFKAASWSKVLKRIAKHGELTLVVKRYPPGTFTHADLNLYTVAEALWIVNRELEPIGYRAMRQGDFLMLMDLDALRSDYRPSAARRLPRADDGPQSTQQSGIQQTAGAQATGPGGEPALLEKVAPETAREATPTEADKAFDEELATRKIKLNFFSTPWSQALPQVAKDAGLILVMKRCPSGSLHRPDVFKKYTVPDAIQILNRELDDTNFRLIRQDKFLIVLYTEDLRVEYDRPVLNGRRGRDRGPGSDVRQVSAQAAGSTPRMQTGIEQAAAISSDAAGAGRVTSDTGPMLLDMGATPASPVSQSPRFAAPAPAASAGLSPVAGTSVKSAQKLEVPDPGSLGPPRTTVYVPAHASAAGIAQRLYEAVRGRSELQANGMHGLPSFRVFEVPPGRGPASLGQDREKASSYPTVVTIALDNDHNRLVIEGAPKRLSAAVHLCKRLDAQSDDSGALQLVSADAETCAVARNLGPELNRLIAQLSPETLAQAPGGNPSPNSSGSTSGSNGNSGNGTGAGNQATPVTGDKGIAEIIKGLKGDVQVESVPELGILILRGGQADVAAVMNVIREIERLSAGTAPKLHLLQLQYVNSDSFARLLNEVYKAISATRTEGGGAGKQMIQVFSVGKPNAVLVLAPPADMPAVLTLARELDQPVNPELEFQVFRLRYGYAAQVAASVTEFYKSPKALGTTVNVFADARTNSLIVQARPRDLVEVGRLIEKLDGPTASQATIKVFPLQNGDATSIQRLLETLFGTAGARTGAQSQPNAEGGTETAAPTLLRLSVDVRTNSIIALGPPDTLRAVEAVITRLDNSDVHQRQTEVIRLKNNAADNVARAITDFVRSQRELQQIDPELLSNVELLEREVFVVSEPISNSLLLSATPRYFTDLKKMIDKLDAPPAQVIIQALIVEVELDNTDEFGIELGFQSPTLFDRSNIGNLTTFQTTASQNASTTVANNVLLSSQATPGFQFGDPSSGLGTNPQNGVAQVGTQELSNLGLGRIDNTLGFGGLVLAASSESVSALLRALSYKQTIHVLSRPQIRTLDNRLASIQVGKRVPVITSATTSALGTIQPIITYDNAGIILTVQPRITPDGMIALEAYAEKSQYELTGGVTLLSTVGGPSIQSPIKDITRAEASVNVASGNTVVLGGMITSSDTTITRKVPWIADVPIIGQAFRYDSKATVRTELLIFLTPRVIRDDADDEMIKQVETERIHFLVDEAEAIHGPILSTRPPVLEECPPEGLPVAPLVPVPGSMRPGLGLPATSMPPAIVPTLPGSPLVSPPQPGPTTPGMMQPGQMPVPSMPGPPPIPALPPAPAYPQAAPVLPPPAMPPAGARTRVDLVPSTAGSSPSNGPAPSNWPTMTAIPASGPPVSRPISGDGKLMRPDDPGAVRTILFEEPAPENDR